MEPMSILEKAATGLAASSIRLVARATVLLIDDEPAVCTTLRAMLKADGHEVVTAANGKEGAGELHRQYFDLAIVDLMMPELDGLQTMSVLKAIDPNLEVILLTGCASVETSVAALKQGACDYLLKPFTMAQIRPAIAHALELRQVSSRDGTLQKNDSQQAKIVLQECRDKLQAVFDGVGSGHLRY